MNGRNTPCPLVSPQQTLPLLSQGYHSRDHAGLQFSGLASLAVTSEFQVSSLGLLAATGSMQEALGPTLAPSCTLKGCRDGELILAWLRLVCAGSRAALEFTGLEFASSFCLFNFLQTV